MNDEIIYDDDDKILDILRYNDVYTIYNISRYTLTILIRPCEISEAIIESDIRYDVSTVAKLYPGRHLTIESIRVDKAQIDLHYANGAITVSDRYSKAVLDNHYKYMSTGSHLRGVYWQIQKLAVNDGAAVVSPLKFGSSATMTNDGIALLVGAPGRNFDSGAVFLYSFNGETYNQSQIITGLNTRAGYNFGQTVSISGDGGLFIASGPHTDGSAGCLYVFFKSGSNYNQLQQIFEPNFVLPSRYGHFILISDDNGTVVVSAPDKVADNKSVGVVYVYKYSFGTYYLYQTITGIDAFADAGDGSAFGDGVDYASGSDIIAVGMPGYNNGKVVIFKNNGTSYVKVNTISCATELVDDTGFGTNLAFGIDELIVCAPDYGNNQGLVEYYGIDSNGAVNLKQYFTGGINDRLGNFALHTPARDELFISGIDDGGVVYAYAEVTHGLDYELRQAISPYVSKSTDQFGYSTATTINGDYVVVGDPGHDSGTGTAYIFKKS
jgi:hypothetical protein